MCTRLLAVVSLIHTWIHLMGNSNQYPAFLKRTQGTEDNFSDTESDSFNSTRTDHTFEPNSFDVSASDIDFSTATESRNTTPTNQELNEHQMPLEALTSSLVHSTPTKKNASMKGRTPAAPLSATPRYNLRSRNRSSSTLNSTLEETPETFARHVKEQLCRSQRNYQKWKMALDKQNTKISD